MRAAGRRFRSPRHLFFLIDLPFVYDHSGKVKQRSRTLEFARGVRDVISKFHQHDLVRNMPSSSKSVSPQLTAYTVTGGHCRDSSKDLPSCNGQTQSRS